MVGINALKTDTLIFQSETNMRTTDEQHSAKMSKMLKGRKIDSCRYMTRQEADDMDITDFYWYWIDDRLDDNIYEHARGQL